MARQQNPKSFISGCHQKFSDAYVRNMMLMTLLLPNMQVSGCIPGVLKYLIHYVLLREKILGL